MITRYFKQRIRLLLGLSLLVISSQSACKPELNHQTRTSKKAAMASEKHSDLDSLDMSQVKMPESESKKAPKTSTDLDMTQLKHAPAESKDSVQKTASTPKTSKPIFPTDPQKKIMYRGPMHPQIIQDHPGKCPICGMNLEPVEVFQASTGQSLQDRAAVKINATRQQLIGVKTTQIQKRQAQHNIRTVARIAHNEKLLSHVHTKYSGWIETVHANFKGQYVAQGQALLSIYSPDLVAAQEEYLLALKTAEQFKDSDFESSRETSQSLVRASEEKLKLYDLSSAQIQKLRNTGQVQRYITIHAQSSGYIIELQAIQGMRVTAGMSLYTLANLSSVWIQARIYENDLASVKIGQETRITLPFIPEAEYHGKVAYIDPYLDPQTRTANLRVVLPNPNGALKPEMFANLEILIQSPQKKLMIPASAVIDTGLQQIAFIAKGDGIFEPVKLKLGQRLGQDYELLIGPAAGTEVVTDAQFLIDSESQLQAVVGQMPGGHNH